MEHHREADVPAKHDLSSVPDHKLLMNTTLKCQSFAKRLIKNKPYANDQIQNIANFLNSNTCMGRECIELLFAIVAYLFRLTSIVLEYSKAI